MTTDFKKSYRHRTLALTDSKLKSLQEMVEFCCVNQLDPRRWLWVLFANKKWFYAPTFNALISKKVIDVYNTIDSSTYRNQGIKANPDKFNPRVDVTATIESIKNRYQSIGQAKTCFDNIRNETLGFHPKSKVCKFCYYQEECKLEIAKILGNSGMLTRSK